MTRAARRRTLLDHMEQCTVAVWPLGKTSSASMARSTSGLWSLATAETTVGSSRPRRRAQWTTYDPMSIMAPPARSAR